MADGPFTPQINLLKYSINNWSVCINRLGGGNVSFILFLLIDRENDITPVLDHTFCVEHNAFGRILQHELKPNGRNVPVTEENKKEYVRYHRKNQLPQT